MENIKYSFKSAHPNAQKLMEEDFYWSPIEETGPYGNDDGWEAVEGFLKWRKANKDVSAVEYLRSLITGWGYPSFDWNELDPEKIKEFIKSPGYSEDEIQQYLLEAKKIAEDTSNDLSNKLSDSQLREMIAAMPSNINLRMLLGYDNAIIGTAFAQIALEGAIEKDMRYLTSTAIKRQLLPLLINNYEETHRENRVSLLKKMFSVIENI